MEKNFKIISLVIFGGAAILGLLFFSGAIDIGKGSKGEGSMGTVVVWGTANMDDISDVLENFNRVNTDFTLQYVQKYEETFDKDLLEALASGNGPDIFLLSNELAYKYSNKIYTIPYKSYPIASFKNTFAGAGEVFLTSNGVLAFPLTIDPLVMYYNRSILDANNIIYPPNNWDELESIVSVVNKKNEVGQLSKSSFALGQFSNVKHAKNIIATLFMQAGNSIVAQKDGRFYASLGDFNSDYDLSSTLDFYTSFTNPASVYYSWNKSFPDSQTAFSSEDLAFYFGYASELNTLINKNPNQDFLVASVPQIKNAKNKLTSAKVTGIAIASSTKNFNAAFMAASLMATGDFASGFSQSLYLVPARRDLLAVNPTDSFFPTFYSSALYAKSWLDPAPNETNDIFRKMIDGILANTFNSRDAISDSNQKLNLLLIR